MSGSMESQLICQHIDHHASYLLADKPDIHRCSFPDIHVNRPKGIPERRLLTLVVQRRCRFRSLLCARP